MANGELRRSAQQGAWQPALIALPMAALTGAAIGLGIAMASRRQAKRSLAFQLHEFYMSPDFYAKVRAPAYNVALQWTHFPKSLRQAYRDVVVSGWSSGYAETKLGNYVSKLPDNTEEIITFHFHKPRGRPSLTEHQALSADLRFWSRLNSHIKLRTIDRAALRSLFADDFRYHRDFYRSLANSVAYATKKSNVKCPLWVYDISELEAFFDAQNQLILDQWPIQARPWLERGNPKSTSWRVGVEAQDVVRGSERLMGGW
jgi:hypothetical protein